MIRRTILATATWAVANFFANPAHAALQAGAPAPAIKAPAYLAGKAFKFNLNDALKKGPVVVYFFPAAFTSGCNIEARMFSVAIDDFAKANTTVIGITAGNLDRLAEFSASTEHCSGKFAVASDPGAKIAKTYDSTLSLKPGWSNRTSYLIGTDGKIKAVYSDLDPKQHVARMLEAAKALKP